MFRYLLSVIVVFVLGIFVEHNFLVVNHLQNQCPHMKDKVCNVSHCPDSKCVPNCGNSNSCCPSGGCNSSK